VIGRIVVTQSLYDESHRGIFSFNQSKEKRMKKWKFEITIPEGYDEFFESLTTKGNEVEELTKLVYTIFAEYGFHKDYGFKVKFKKRKE
jgi:hypothetical protein